MGQPASAYYMVKKQLLEAMPAFSGGGEMIKEVTTWRKQHTPILPYKFEAGTPNIGDAVAFKTGN